MRHYLPKWQKALPHLPTYPGFTQSTWGSASTQQGQGELESAESAIAIAAALRCHVVLLWKSDPVLFRDLACLLSLGQPGKLPRHNLGGVSGQWELASWFHHPLAVWLWAGHLTSLVTSLSVSSDTD